LGDTFFIIVHVCINFISWRLLYTFCYLQFYLPPIRISVIHIAVYQLNTAWSDTCVCCLSGLDPCLAGTVNCSENAYCIPTDTTYRCECKTGFYGDGLSCEGMRDWFFLFI